MRLKDQLIKRTSVRDFTTEKMDAKTIAELTEVINNAPTSVNHQQFSAIIITDEELKQFISTNNWNQKHIADSAAFVLFLGDRSRFDYAMSVKGKSFNKEYTMHEYTRVVVDATIAATQAHDYLISENWGVTFVGGVLGFIDKIKEQFNLPETVFPILGLSVGRIAKENAIKPKMNKVFINEYSLEQSNIELERYSTESFEYFQSIGNKYPFIDQLAIVSESKSYGPAFLNASKELEKIIKNFK